MLSDVLAHIRNYFVVPDGIHAGAYTITGGTLALSFLQNDQYFRICGSVFNDGVYKYPVVDLSDETFTGAVWALAVPARVVELSAEIDAWCAKNAASALTSESWLNYSYTKATTKNGRPLTWKQVFQDQLNGWRKL